MGDDWLNDRPDPRADGGLRATLRAVPRAVPIFTVIGLGLVLMLVLRLVEAPLFSPRRPLTQWITPLVCRAVLWLLGFTVVRVGQPDEAAGFSVSNHSTWLDIFALNAGRRLYFISKADVRSWPGIGWLARATGTVFVKRERKEASAQVRELEARLAAEHHLHLFPEGTSTDGIRVLPFKPTLFAAVAKRDTLVQPITLRYHAPEDEDPRFYGWWGDMDFAPSMMDVLKARPQGSIEIIYQDAVSAVDLDRKALARVLEGKVKAAFDA